MDTGRRGFLKIIGLAGASAAATTAVEAVAKTPDPRDGAKYLGAVSVVQTNVTNGGRVAVTVLRRAEANEEIPPICFKVRPVRSYEPEEKAGVNDAVYEFEFASWKALQEAVAGFNPSIMTGSRGFMRAPVYLTADADLGQDA